MNLDQTSKLSWRLKPWSLFCCLIISVGSLTSCGSRDLTESAETAYPADFVHLRDRILRPRCGSCHPKILQYKEVVSHLAVSGKPQASELYTVLESGEMPPYGSKLSDGEKEAVKQWIIKGLPLD